MIAVMIPHTPYFLRSDAVLPASGASALDWSESDFLLLVSERAEPLRRRPALPPSRSLRVNFWPPSECTEGGLEGGPLREALSSPAEGVGDIRGAVGGGCSFL